VTGLRTDPGDECGMGSWRNKLGSSVRRSALANRSDEAVLLLSGHERVHLKYRIA
jgi:hypothetical protein